MESWFFRLVLRDFFVDRGLFLVGDAWMSGCHDDLASLESGRRCSLVEESSRYALTHMPILLIRERTFRALLLSLTLLAMHPLCEHRASMPQHRCSTPACIWDAKVCAPACSLCLSFCLSLSSSSPSPSPLPHCLIASLHREE